MAVVVFRQAQQPRRVETTANPAQKSIPNKKYREKYEKPKRNSDYTPKKMMKNRIQNLKTFADIFLTA